jgi:hypothetical protein
MTVKTMMSGWPMALAVLMLFLWHYVVSDGKKYQQKST